MKHLSTLVLALGLIGAPMASAGDTASCCTEKETCCAKASGKECAGKTCTPEQKAKCAADAKKPKPEAPTAPKA